MGALSSCFRVCLDTGFLGICQVDHCVVIDIGSMIDRLELDLVENFWGKLIRRELELLNLRRKGTGTEKRGEIGRTLFRGHSGLDFPVLSGPRPGLMRWVTKGIYLYWVFDQSLSLPTSVMLTSRRTWLTGRWHPSVRFHVAVDGVTTRTPALPYPQQPNHRRTVSPYGFVSNIVATARRYVDACLYVCVLARFRVELSHCDYLKKKRNAKAKCIPGSLV